MKKLLVPTDFSANADKALAYAVALARLSGAEIHLLHAAQVTDSNTTFPVNPQYAAYAGDNEEGVKQLAALKELHSEVNIQTHVYAGFVLESIVKASEDLGIDLVVIGTLGNSGVREKLFGSVTASLIGKSNIPVLAIPLMAEWNEPKKILFAINEFDEEPGRMEMLITLADVLKANMEMTVFTDEDSADADRFITNARGITFYEEKLRSYFAGSDVKATRLYGSNFQDALEDYINQNNIDILAMVTHKRNFFERLFTRSITKKISYHTDIPLLVMPA